eukprot:TRINITY_DN12305_c0_g1_i1.p1 TRINITY_DN12305_c0_g1~~TRINITY_DN12305_c0_g1_i1.p1  ORF type:complete len:630 (+),score=85.09 TRINITY_DN12305_c0_g1_i1:1-1890(+)
MEAYGATVPFSTSENLLLAKIATSTAAISLVTTTLMVLSFIFFRSMLFGNKVTSSVSTCLVFFMTVFQGTKALMLLLQNSFYLSTDQTDYNDPTSTAAWLCYMQAIIAHLCDLLSFGMAVSISVHIYQYSIRNNAKFRVYEKLYHGLSWLISIILTSILIVKKQFSYNVTQFPGTWCWVKPGNYLFYTYDLPLVIVILFTTTVHIAWLYISNKRMKEEFDYIGDRSRVTAVVKMSGQLLLLCSLFILTYIGVFFTRIFDGIGFFIIAATGWSLYGIVIIVLYPSILNTSLLLIWKEFLQGSYAKLMGEKKFVIIFVFSSLASATGITIQFLSWNIDDVDSEYIPPVTTSAFQSTTGFILLVIPHLIFPHLRKGLFDTLKDPYFHLKVLGIGFMSSGISGETIHIVVRDSLHVSSLQLLNSITPLVAYIVLLLVFREEEKATYAGTAGLLFGLVGNIFVYFHPTRGITNAYIFDVGIASIPSISWGIASVTISKILTDTPSTTIAMMDFFYGSISNWLFSLAFESREYSKINFGLYDITIIVYGVVYPVYKICYYWILKKYGPIQATAIYYISPIIGMIEIAVIESILQNAEDNPWVVFTDILAIVCVLFSLALIAARRGYRREERYVSI